MKKIEKLSIASIFEAVVNEGNNDKITAVSIGAGIQIKKSAAGAGLFINTVAGAAAGYKKVEDKDLELPILQNELAGIVGDFDSKVHSLMSSYGYDWINPAAKPKPEPTLESVNEAEGANPVGTWVGDFYVSQVISISKFVDKAAEFYNFDDQAMENKFRNKIKEIVKDIVGEMYDVDGDSDEAIADTITSVLADHTDDLTEFEDYRTA